MIGTVHVLNDLKILELALVSPNAAFMQLLLGIDRELRKLLISTGVLRRYFAHLNQSFLIALELLGAVQGATIPEELKDKVSELWTLRNNVIHGGSEVPFRAFELGLSVLRVLQNVPRPSYIVKKVNVPLYADKNCSVERGDVKGIWLETIGSDGVSQGARIHPTTRKYEEGLSVGWEWSNDDRQSWGETWYKHPETGKCTPAWSGSMEFIGRDINEV